MPSLDDLKKRIKSVKSTQKITKAMKMVAAAKLRKAQESAEKGRPYSQKMQNIILNLTKSINDPQNAPKLFDDLRKSYPVRREFNSFEISRSGISENVSDQLLALGFNLQD